MVEDMTFPPPVWIGPTECDDERISRAADLDKVWEIVKPMLQGSNFKLSTYGIMSLPLDLLREALNCYQNGAYLATCAISRACVEASLYLASTQKPTNDRDTIQVREDLIRKKREIFLKSALEDKLLSYADVQTVRNIWEAGDFAVHIHQKLDKNHRQWLQDSGDRKSVNDSLKGWSNRKEALETITHTATIVSKFLCTLNERLK